MRNISGYSRWCYNKALEIWKDLYKKGLKPTQRLVRDELKTQLPSWSKGYPKMIVDTSCEHLGFAFLGFFAKRTKYPKFKSKRKEQDSFEFYRKDNSSIRLRNKYWLLQKEQIKMSEDVRYSGTPKRLTCSRKNGKYYISVIFDDNNPAPTDNGKYVGLDWGLKHYFVSDRGEAFDMRSLDEFYEKIRFRQKDLSRKKRGSKRYAKARAKLSRIYERLDNVKRDEQNKMVKKIVDEYSHVAVEDLSMRGLVRINHGKHAKIRKMLVYSNYEIRKALECKVFDFVEINRFFPSSQTCSACGLKHPEMKDEKNRRLVCSCGADLDRDVNAAKNIKSVAFKN